MTNEEAIERIKTALDMDDIEGHCYILTKDADRKALYLAIKALKVMQGIEDAYMRELLKTPLERGVPISDACDGCRYELNSTNGNPCYSCGKYKLSEQQPSETPKIGKWKRISPAKIYECSECGQVVMTDDIDVYKYCHGCGGKMG